MPQLTMMFRALLASPVRNTLFILSGVLVAVVAKELKDSTVIHIGRQVANDSPFKRVIAKYYHPSNIAPMQTAHTATHAVSFRSGRMTPTPR